MRLGPWNNGPFCIPEGFTFGIANWIVFVGLVVAVVIALVIAVVVMRIRTRRIVYQSIY